MYAILDIASHFIRIRVAEQIGWVKDLMTHSKKLHLFCAWLDKLVLVGLVTQRLPVWVSVPAGCTGLSSTTHNWGALAQNTEPPNCYPGAAAKIVWVKCRSQTPSMGYHTWPHHVTFSLTFSAKNNWLSDSPIRDYCRHLLVKLCNLQKGSLKNPYHYTNWKSMWNVQTQTSGVNTNQWTKRTSVQPITFGKNCAHNFQLSNTWFIEYIKVSIVLPHGDVKYVAAYRARDSHVSQAFSCHNHTGDEIRNGCSCSQNGKTHDFLRDTNGLTHLREKILMDEWLFVWSFLC